MPESGKSRRGFASMDPDRQREIASKGGRAAHAKGTAHEWTAEEARNAGKKGGEAVSQDRAHMAAIGREGGEARGAGVRARRGNGDGGHFTEREMTLTVNRDGIREPGDRGRVPVRGRSADSGSTRERTEPENRA